MNSTKVAEKRIYVGTFFALLFLLVITLTVTTSYGYFLAQISTDNPDASLTEVNTMDLKATYTDGTDISLANAIPGSETRIKTISLQNTGNVNINYKINWKTITNSGLTGLKYTITCDTTGITGTGTKLDVPASPTTLISGTLAPNAIHTCQLQLFYTDTNLDQSTEKGKTFSTTLEATIAPSI